ncbi:MAG: outer membrane protein beta-barrel protein [Gemmatimonadetes bacterium]|nr:outer membrane protein beta-barrel protein [Gemmatimonadota bacterium]
MKKTASVLAALAAAAVAGRASAQIPVPNITPFSVEVRAGAAVPTSDFKKDLDLSTGYTVSGNVTYHAMPLLGIYAGYSYDKYKSPGLSDLAGATVHVVDRGFNAGVRLGIPTPLIPIDPYVKAGVLVGHTIRLESGSDHSDNVDGKVGFEVGAGVGFTLGPKISVTPGVTFQSYSLKDSTSGDTKVQSVKADIGIRIRI